MKATTSMLLKKYAEMSGDKKVRIGMSLSKMVRDIRKAGKEETKRLHGTRPSTTS